MNDVYVFDTLFEKIEYPSGEFHIKLRNGSYVRLKETSLNKKTITAHIRDFNGLCETITADKILKRVGLNVQWFIPFFPFARDDRRHSSKDGSELELALEMVKDLDIIVADPHSEVSETIKHSTQETSVQVFKEHGIFKPNHLAIIPDAGATKKATTWLGGKDYVQCLKKRDPLTGKLSGFQVLTEDIKNRDCIIIDDICDGGGTFLGLAKELKEKGAGSLTLAVTHGLFTKGTKELRRFFTNITAFGEKENIKNVYTIPYEELLQKGKFV